MKDHYRVFSLLLLAKYALSRETGEREATRTLLCGATIVDEDLG
jgi:hypothetical protein